MNIEDLLAYIEDYEGQYKKLILEAYKYAKVHHGDTKRKSGEPYLIHPVAVACILAKMHADADTIAAGLLHDTLEDCPEVTYEELETKFNKTIADLVEGVTKIRKTDVKDPNEREQINKRKIVESLTKDVRIFIIKLADRLHNMSTLEYQTPEKQIIKSRETMNLYVPFATLIGSYTVKLQLEDMCFKYLNPEEYGKIAGYDKKVGNKTVHVKGTRELMDEDIRDELDIIIADIEGVLIENGIKAKIIKQDKNVYGLYKRLRRYGDLKSVHDAVTLKIIVDAQQGLNDVDICYKTMDILKRKYKTIPGRDKDFISAPKSNMYRGLHETIKMKNGYEIQFQVKSPQMYEINAFGITALWNIYKTNLNINSAYEMQNRVQQLQFFKTLKEIVESDLPTNEFTEVIDTDLAAEETIEVYSLDKNCYIKLPKGSTAVDLAYKIGKDVGNYLVSCKQDRVSVPIDMPLHDRAVIELFSDRNLVDTSRDLSNACITKMAKRKIKDFRKNNI
jgi:GTP pyrophosphokinase